MNKLKNKGDTLTLLQSLVVGLLLGAALAGLIILGLAVESKRREVQQYKEAIEEVAEDCIYTVSKGKMPTDLHLQSCEFKLNLK